MDKIVYAAPNGLGDAIYLRAVALHLLDKGESVNVVTMWDEVFRDLPVSISTWAGLVGDEQMRYVAYSMRHKVTGEIKDFNQFQLCCYEAGIQDEVKLDFRWKMKNTKWRDEIMRNADGRKILIYQPIKRENIFTPHIEAFNRWLHSKSDYYRIRIGHPELIITGSSMECELDLVGKITRYDVFDIATIGDLFFGELCFLPMLAEAMNKNFVCMFSKRASKNPEYNHVNFQRMFHKYYLGAAIYDN